MDQAEPLQDKELELEQAKPLVEMEAILQLVDKALVRLK